MAMLDFVQADGQGERGHAPLVEQPKT